VAKNATVKSKQGRKQLSPLVKAQRQAVRKKNDLKDLEEKFDLLSPTGLLTMESECARQQLRE